MVIIAIVANLLFCNHFLLEANSASKVLLCKTAYKRKAKAIVTKPPPSKESILLVDFQMAGTISVIPIVFLAIGVQEANIKPTITNR